MSELLQLQRRIEELESTLSRLKRPERGRSLYSQGQTVCGATVDLNYDNNNHRVFGTPTIVVPAGGYLEAHLHTDFHLIQTTTAISGFTNTLYASTYPDIGTSYGVSGFRYSVGWANTRNSSHHKLQGIYNAETSLTLDWYAGCWTYTQAWIRCYSTWSRIEWMVFV